MAFLPGIGGTSIGQALVQIRADTHQVRAEIAKMNGEIRAGMVGTGNTIQKETSKWGGAFSALKMGTLAVGAGLVLFALDGIKATAALDKAMGKVYALTGVSAKAMVDLRAQVVALSTVVPQGPAALADGLYYVISAGFSAADALKVLKVAAMDATSGLTDTKTVADGLTSAMNAYGYSADQAAHVSDIMTSAVVQGKMQWSELASSIGAAAVTGATAGVSLEQVTSAISAMTRDGLTAGRASKNLAFLIRSLEAPTATSTKEFKALGVTYDQNTLKSKGLFGTLQMLSTAAGKHHDVIVRAKNGNIDWAKSAVATEAANKGWASAMKTMTGSAAGFLVAQILMQNSGKSYNQILAASYKATGLTTDAFNKMKETDPGVAFDLLKNKVQAAAIAFGTMLMPKLAAAVSWLSDNVPKALETIAGVWNSVLGPAVFKMLGAFGDLAGAVVAVFMPAAAGGSGDTFKTMVTGIASVIAQIANDAGIVARVLSIAFGNPIVSAVAKIAASMLIMRAAFGFIRSAGASMNSTFKSMASGLTGGFLFPKGTSSATPATAAGEALQAGATKAADIGVVGATKAADILVAGATAAAEGGAASGAVRSAQGIVSPAIPGGVIPMGPGGGVPIGATALTAGEQAAMAAAAGGYGPKVAGEVSKGVVASLKSGASTIGTSLKGGISLIGSKLSGALGFVSKAFFPLMIADMGIEMLKAPIGQFISDNTQFKRAGAKISQDFFGGVFDLLTKSLTGADASVGRADTMQIGNVKISTVTLARLGITNATFDKLEAPVGTITNAEGKAGAEQTLSASLSRASGESVNAWYNRLMDELKQADTSTQDQIQKILNDPATYSQTGFLGIGYEIRPEAEAQIAALLQGSVNTQVGTMSTATRDAYMAALRDTLTGKGFTVGQMRSLSTTQLASLGSLINADANGQYSGLVTYMTNSYLGAFGAATKKGSTKVPGEHRAGGGGKLPVLLSSLKSDEELSLKAIEDFYATVPVEARQALDRFMAEGAPSVAPKVQAALNKMFGTTGTDWVTGFRTGTVKVNKTIAAEMKAQLGPGWRGILQSAGQALYERMGGADGARLAKDLAAAISGAVGKLTPEDLSTTAKKVKPARAAVAKALGTDAAQAALQAASGDDTTKAKKGFEALGKALGKAIPDASARERFIGTLVALQKAATVLPQVVQTADGLVTTSGTAVTMLSDSTATLNSRAAQFRDIINSIKVPGAGSGTTSGGGGGGGRRLAASGVVFDTKGATDLTVGEAAGEHVAVLRNFQKIRLPKVPSLTQPRMALAGAAPKPSPRTQQLFVDTMYLTSKPERDSILEAVQFLSPDGR